VIDPNVVISSLIAPAGRSANLISVVPAAITPVISLWWLQEINDVIHRPKQRRWYSAEQGERTVQAIQYVGEMHLDVTSPFPLTQDPGDDYLIALADTAKVDMIISGDGGVLGTEYPPAPIYSPRGALQTIFG
jgi:putative PIN family toxin of toxin-antitoxin system